MRSLIGPLWYSSISAVYATTTGTVSIGRMKIDVVERLAAERLVHQVGERKSDQEAADRGAGGECQRAHDRPAEARIGQHLAEKIEADKFGLRPLPRYTVHWWNEK